MTRVKFTAIAAGAATLLAVSLVASGFVTAAVGGKLAANPKSGGYFGSTGQGESIRFRVKKQKFVKRLHFGYQAECSSGTASGDVTIVKRLRIRNGRFHYDSGTTKVKGRFVTRRKAKGRLRVTSTTYDPTFGSTTCDSGSVRWTATR